MNGDKVARGGSVAWRWLGGGALMATTACGSQGAPAMDAPSTASGAVAAQSLALVPGTDPLGLGPTQVQFGSIVPVVTETGLLSLSVDGVGMLDDTGTMVVDKPAGATVRRAFLAAASRGASGRRLLDGDVTLDGEPSTWLISTPSSIASWNHWAEVTEIIAPKLDAAEPGLVEVSVTERLSADIDGEILAVIFDDPNRRDVSTVALMFGAQQVQGDAFHVRLADAVDLENAELRLTLSLGISFGYLEGSSHDQFSVVDVNGQRLTSSAGGQDDGVPANGALLTVGGVGDALDNPPPEEQPPEGADNTRFDDELYDLRPFARTGDTELTIFTQNPSNDDNIFFSALLVSGAAVIGEGVVLGPASARAPVGETHTLTASVQDELGRPVVDREVTFNVIAGPNAGDTAVDTTDAAGQAELVYIGDGGTGVDEILASFVDARGRTQFSNVALEEWFAVDRPPLASCVDVERDVGEGCAIDVSPAEVGVGSSDPDGDPLSFTLEPPGPFGLGATPVVLTVADNSGLSASCSATVTAVDSTPPALSLPQAVTTGCSDASGAVVAFEASATDNCGGAALTCLAADGRVVTSGSTFPLGSTSVTCEAADASGNVASGSFSVTVTPDPAAPVIECNAPESVSGDTTITATASNGCSGPLTVDITEHRCWSVDGSGRRLEDRDCSVCASGADLTIGDVSCTTRWIEWTVRAVDDSGNETTQDCRVRVDGRHGHDDGRGDGHGDEHRRASRHRHHR